MRVEELMTHPVKTCRSSDSLNAPAQIMWECDVGCVPVVNAANQVVGMITDRDIAMAAYTQGTPLEVIRVESAMSKHVHTCGPLDSVSSAEKAMQANQVRRLPVVDPAGELVGVVSMNDIAIEAAREKGMRRPAVPLDGLALTLASVCQRRGPVPIVEAQ